MKTNAKKDDTHPKKKGETAKKEFRKSQRRNYLNSLKKNNAKKLRRKLLSFTSDSTVKTHHKKHEKNPTLDNAQKAKMQDDFRNYMSLLSKMAKTNLIHPNKASRLTSRMSKKVSSKII